MMQLIMEAASIAIAFIAGISLYFISIKTLLPALFMKVRFSSNKNPGRGLKKFVSDGGRAVLYEPHPSLRKYISKYLLYTKNKYKYFKCEIDETIVDINYGIVMFDARGKVIDVLNVCEAKNVGSNAHSVLLHHETSYVSLVLYSVNGENANDNSIGFYHKFSNVALYGLCVSLLTFLISLLSVWTIDSWINAVFAFDSGISAAPMSYVIPSLLVGALAVSLNLLFSKKKGVRVVFHDKHR